MNSTQENFKILYDSRYKNGYMSGWPPEKKRRVARIIKQLKLPQSGVVLDYGCGKGEFTSVLKSALPGWRVVGSDISDVAVELARYYVPNCEFVSHDLLMKGKQSFDLIFTHHVLEHVQDVSECIKEMADLCLPQAMMVHILPSLHPKSFEYWVVDSVIDGIDPAKGNRYYFEHSGHMRRLSSGELSNRLKQHGFLDVQLKFSDFLFGSFNWISRSDLSTISNMFYKSKTKSIQKRIAFYGLGALFFFITALRYPVTRFKSKVAKARRSRRLYLLVLIYFLVYPLSILVDRVIVGLALGEWMIYQKSGSEMYLVNKRE